jgi:sugar phosphate isomerase/epimerase
MENAKLCITSWSYHRALGSGKMDLDGFLHAARDAGAAGVDIVKGHFPRGGISALRNSITRARAMGLEVVALGMAGDLTRRSGPARRKMGSDLTQWMRLAKSVDVSAIRVFAGDSSICDSAERRARSLLRSAAPLARKLRIRIAMENHWGISVNPDSAWRMLRGLPRPWIGSCLDIGNFSRDDRTSLYGVRRLAPLAVHVHVKDFGGANRREGLDQQASIGIIRRTGYQGWFSLEYEGEENELKEVPRAFARMKRASTSP